MAIKVTTVTAKDMVKGFRDKFNILEDNSFTAVYVPSTEKQKLERQLARLKTFKREVYDDSKALQEFNKLNEKCHGIYASSGEPVPFDAEFNVDDAIERLKKMLEDIDNGK